MKKMGTPGRPIRVAIVGVGGRGYGQMQTLLGMPDVKVAVVCDKYADRVKRALDWCEEHQGFRPDGTLDYREAVVRDDIEAVIVMTNWTTHVRIAVDAMRAGKYAAMEVGGAASVEECWKLVHTSEETGMPCMMLENCCYNDVEMALLNMVKKGVFGEIVHCEGGYIHDLCNEIGYGDTDRHYRQENFIHRNGELYPTHELGPIAKYINLNRGNRMLLLVSMASKARGMNAWFRQNRPDHPLAALPFNEGDVVTTMIKCANGETISLRHDCSLIHPYSRGGMIEGTNGVWQEANRSLHYAGGSHDVKGNHCGVWWKDDEDFRTYQHPLWKEYTEFGLRGGHGGMDYLALRAFVEAVQERKPTPIDVYDTASWMVITALSEQSVAMGSLPVPIPDFTDGMWIGREAPDTGMYSLDVIPE